MIYIRKTGPLLIRSSEFDRPGTRVQVAWSLGSVTRERCCLQGECVRDSAIGRACLAVLGHCVQVFVFAPACAVGT